MKKQLKTTQIVPFIPPTQSNLSFAEIKARHTITNLSDGQRITKGESYFHHIKSGLNYTYNGFFDAKTICLINPVTRALEGYSEKQLQKNFMFAGPESAMKH